MRRMWPNRTNLRPSRQPQNVPFGRWADWWAITHIAKMLDFPRCPPDPCTASRVGYRFRGSIPQVSGQAVGGGSQLPHHRVGDRRGAVAAAELARLEPARERVVDRRLDLARAL